MLHFWRRVYRFLYYSVVETCNRRSPLQTLPIVFFLAYEYFKLSQGCWGMLLTTSYFILVYLSYYRHTAYNTQINTKNIDMLNRTSFILCWIFALSSIKGYISGVYCEILVWGPFKKYIYLAFSLTVKIWSFWPTLKNS